ncbi:hypothetical protein [Candidatus Endomicrobiellum pyrsonymphae]|uniref:hypothetical protein n=1 Tax=Candidatus Endomicrobiellum pyrsonymphae TaxID=1408203 RepID=UPI0035A8A3B2
MAFADKEFVIKYAFQYYGITNNFDNIVQQRITFTNAYANGYMSIFEISASLSGIPLMPGALTRMYSLELMKWKIILNIFLPIF